MSTANIVTYCLYRILAWLLSRLSHIYTLLVARQPAAKPVELLAIVHRRKYCGTDCARVRDFMLWHSAWAKFEHVYEPQWSLYSMDERHVYFVRTDGPFREYTVDRSPFVYMDQFSDARCCARIAVEDFKRVKMPALQGQLVFFTNTPRSGTTLLAKILQSGDNTLVFGEPDIITSLASLLDGGKVDADSASKLVTQALLYIGKECASADETIVVKTQSNGNILVPAVADALPQVRHLFCFRRSVPLAVKSCEKMLGASGEGGDIVRLQKLHRSLPQALIGLATLEPAAMHSVRPATVRQLAAMVFAAPLARAIAYECGIFGGQTTLVSYERLLAEPERTVRRVRILCGVDNDDDIGAPNDALSQCMATDAQAGTPLSRQKLQADRTGEQRKGDADSDSLQCVANALGLPHDFFDKHFDGFAGV